MARVEIPTREEPIDEREKYPSNSNRHREQKEKTISKIVEGGAVKRKKGLGRKLEDTLIGDNRDGLWDYIIGDILIPAAKETIADAVSGGIQMLLFGERQSRGSSKRSSSGSTYSRPYVSYSSIYRRDEPKRVETRPLNDKRTRYYSDEIVLETRGEAEDVIDHLIDIIEQYDAASVADLYELVGIESTYTDNKYGWDNLAKARVRSTRDGYVLDLPRAHVID